MSPTTQGAIVLITTILVFMTGAPVAFALGAIGIAFLVIFQGVSSLGAAAETLYSGLHDFTLVSIPMFVMMGAAIGSSPAGRDLYIALDRWLYRVPGGLVISNLGACAIFAALTGSSPATCAAIGKMGIPEMRRRGYPDEVATGSICAGGTLGILIPPSITFILYGIATETSIGRLFLAGVMPGLMLTALFMLWTLFYIWRSGFRAYDVGFRYSWAEKFRSIPKVAPFLVIIIGVMYALYGGIATPSEAAGVGAALCVILAVLIYRMWSPLAWWEILRSTTREFGHDPDDHRDGGAVQLHAHVALHHPDPGAIHCGCGSQSLGFDGHHQYFPVGLRLLHTTGRHHLDDSADPFADHHQCRFRSGLVRRDCHHQYGDWADHAAGRAQSLRGERDRPGRAHQQGALGFSALCSLYDAGDRDLVHLPRNSHMVA